MTKRKSNVQVGGSVKKKPDRFERIVLREMKKQDAPGNPCIWLNAPDVVKLLRKDHRWMVRMVKKVDAWQAEQLADDSDAISVILHQLKKRARPFQNMRRQ